MTCCHGNSRSGLLDTLLALPRTGYYYGDITVDEAESVLRDEPNGAFILRDSSDSHSHTDLFTITFKIQDRFGSVRVDYAKGYFSLSLQDPGLPLFHTLMDLVSYCQHRSCVQKLPVCVLTGHRQNHDVHLYLTKPVSRHRRMHSLMFMCRDAIHRLVTRDQLDKLGLPKRLIEFYVSQNPYFDEQQFPPESPEDLGSGTDLDTRSAGSRNSLQLNTGGDGQGYPYH